MTYVSWGAFYEGTTDQAYFDLMIPRVMDEVVMIRGTRNVTIPPAPAIKLERGPVRTVAATACSAKDTFHLIFVHADTGGRSVSGSLAQRSLQYCKAMFELCAWPPVRCISVAPQHETEAWILADPTAVTSALGYRGTAASIGLPVDAGEAERLSDPKRTLAIAIGRVRGRRRNIAAQQMFAAIAQRQSLPALRQSKSFAIFESAISAALADLGCIAKVR